MESARRKNPITAEETVDLIKMVKERECLWDRTSISYKDRAAKDMAWNEIYRMIEPDYDNLSGEMKNIIGIQITKKWYNIRDAYVKSKKLQGVRQKPYLHSKLLSFLDDSIAFKKFDDSVVYEESENDESEDQWENEVLIVEDDMDFKREAKRPKLDDSEESKDDTANVNTDYNIVTLLADLVNRENDEDRAFFSSIMPAVKKLSEDSKFEFRVRMINTLKKLLKQDRRSETNKKLSDEEDFE